MDRGYAKRKLLKKDTQKAAVFGAVLIKGGEKKPFRITYSDQGFLYIAQGYEVQPTTGYSVEVKELYETETAVCIKTTLIGPKKGEEKEKAETYPYIVVQTEDVKKDVLFKGGGERWI